MIYFKVRAAAIIICSFSACLGVAAKEGPSLSGFVPVLKLKPTGAVEAGYLSPDGLRSLVVGRGGYGLTAFINPVKPAEPALSYQNEPFYTMTGAVWLPKHGHIFVESSDQGTAEYRLGLLDAQNRYHELNPLQSPHKTQFIEGYYILYGASADGTSIVHGYSTGFTLKPLKRRYFKRRYYRLPPKLTAGA